MKLRFNRSAPGVVLGTLLHACTLAAVEPTAVQGPITADTTWTAKNSPYLVSEDLVVENGAALTIEPGVTRTDAPVQLDLRTRAVVVIGNFCKTRESCFYFAQTLPQKMKKNLFLDLTADSTCIGPTPH